MDFFMGEKSRASTCSNMLVQLACNGAAAGPPAPATSPLQCQQPDRLSLRPQLSTRSLTVPHLPRRLQPATSSVSPRVQRASELPIGAPPLPARTPLRQPHRPPARPAAAPPHPHPGMRGRPPAAALERPRRAPPLPRPAGVGKKYEGRVCQWQNDRKDFAPHEIVEYFDVEWAIVVELNAGVSVGLGKRAWKQCTCKAARAARAC